MSGENQSRKQRIVSFGSTHNLTRGNSFEVKDDWENQLLELA